MTVTEQTMCITRTPPPACNAVAELVNGVPGSQSRTVVLHCIQIQPGRLSKNKEYMETENGMGNRVRRARRHPKQQKRETNSSATEQANRQNR